MKTLRIALLASIKVFLLFFLLSPLVAFPVEAQQTSVNPGATAYNTYYQPVKNGWALDSIYAFTGTGTLLRKSFYKHDAEGRILDEEILMDYYGWNGQYRSQYEYDDNGVESSISFNWDTNAKAWIPSSKNTNGLWKDNTRQYMISASYSWTGSAWYGFFKTENVSEWVEGYGYKPLGSMGYSWNGTDWAPLTKSEVIQDETVSSIWNATTLQWDLSSRTRWRTLNDGPAGFVTQQLESWTITDPVWVPINRNYYQYDSNNNAIRTIIARNDATVGAERWVVYQSQEATYDNSGRPTYQLDSVLNTTTGVLLPQYKRYKGYDANGNITYEENYRYDQTTSSWLGDNKKVCTFYGPYRLTNSETYSWDGILSKWTGASKYTETYNSDSLIDTHTDYYWSYSEPFEWVVNSKKTYYYNSAKLDTLVKTDIFNPSTNTWSPYYLKRSQYNASFDRTSGYTLQWSSTDKKWIDNQRDSAWFDEHHNKVRQISYEWNKSYKKLMPQSSLTYFFSRLNTAIEVADKKAASSIGCWTGKGYLHLVNKRGADLVRVYALDGRLVATKQLNQDGETFELPQGLYLVILGSERIKVMVP